MNGKYLLDLVSDFIKENKLEEVEWEYSHENNRFQFTVYITEIHLIEYCMYLEDEPATFITEVTKIFDDPDADEAFYDISSEEALKLRGLA